MTRRMVLAQDPTGEVVAIGPVHLDQSVTELRDELEAAGWADRGPARYLSAAEFRAQVAAAAKAAVGPCGRCGKPVAQPGETILGLPSDRALFCDACIDRCHEATEFGHICPVCASPDEARARGWAVRS